MNYLEIKNNESVLINKIPVLNNYEEFHNQTIEILKDNINRHCIHYFAIPYEDKFRLFNCIADDSTHKIYVFSVYVSRDDKLLALSKKLVCYEKFERTLNEDFGLNFIDHPWLKPVRYPFYSRNTLHISNYEFYKIDSDEVHEVGVGPIHAGIIEPGHFRFICNGEKILHLEIQLGYQHRGIEYLLKKMPNILQKNILAENIAGDTVIGHTTAFASVIESLSEYNLPEEYKLSRTIALELERIAMHTADLSALCNDIAYQLGNAVLGRLRTPIVNFFQEWCGNRLAKSLIKPFGDRYLFNNYLKERLLSIFELYERDFFEITDEIFESANILSRFENTGTVSLDDLKLIGAVGMTARMGGLFRDIRKSHPSLYYSIFPIDLEVLNTGDVYARALLRKYEIINSIEYIKHLLNNFYFKENLIECPQIDFLKLKPSMFTISLIEGWRGEICHCALTDENGELFEYKIKDPSFHNWMALALAVRNIGISDFPLCNKSFNLSYCGHDL